MKFNYSLVAAAIITATLSLPASASVRANDALSSATPASVGHRPPIASLSVETTSESIVSGKFKSLTYNKTNTEESRYFDISPSPTFAKAKFTYDTHESPTEYIWESSSPNDMTVSPTGEVTILREFFQPVTITATSRKTGAVLSDTKNKPHSWIDAPKVKMNYADSISYCQGKGKTLMARETWSDMRLKWFPDGIPSETFGLDDIHWSVVMKGVDRNKPYAASLNSSRPGLNANVNDQYYVACVNP